MCADFEPQARPCNKLAHYRFRAGLAFLKLKIHDDHSCVAAAEFKK